MANTSVDGLISGLSTTDVINQLLQLERMPQTRLEAQRRALDVTTTALQSLNTRFDTLKQTASALATPTGWQAMKASTSDSARIAVTATGTALPAQLSLSVERLATSHTMVSEVAVAGLETVVASGPITFTVGGNAADPIDVGDGTLSSVVSAINEAGAGVRAAAVQVAPGQYRLQLSATATGADGSFTVDAVSLAALADPFEVVPDAEAFDVITAGTDAEIKVGGSNGYSVVSSTNTFVDLLPGVTVTARQAEPGVLVSVDVATDADALAAKVEQLVNAVNGALGRIAEATSYNSASGTKGPLLGSGLARQLQQNIYESLRLDLPGTSLGDVGMKLGANGLELDKAKLIEAFAADPAKVIEAFTGADTVEPTDGLATKLAALATRASDPTTGMVSVAITSSGDRAATFDRQIAAWDVRLATRESTLRRQYAAMETALGSLRNQSTWLSGQISSLPGWDRS